MSEPSPPPPRPRRSRRRILLILIAVAVVLPILLVLAGIVGLRSASLRRAVLAEVAQYLEHEYGLALAADDFEARWNGLALRGLKVGAPGAAPLLTASRVDAALDFRTLHDPVRVIRSLEIDDARLDLAAPVPKLPESRPGAPPGFEIQRLVLHRGTVVGPPPTPPLSDRVRSWRLDQIEGGGSFVDGLWDLNVESAMARVERPGFAPQMLRVSTRISYRDGEPIQIAALRAAGDGLRLEGSGRVGLEGTPLAAAFDVQAEPRLLVAGAPPGGSLRARGDVRLPEATGRVAVVARDVPAELLRPYVDPGLFQDLSLAGTVADAQANVTLGPETLARVSGTGQAVWRKPGRELVRMDFTVEPGSGEAVLLTAEGDLLPGSAGRRHFRGNLSAAGWAELASATVERIDAELRIPDVQAALNEVRTLWPRLVPALPEGVPVQGTLEADARLSGNLSAPLLKADATWLPEPGARVHVKADGRPLAKTGSARAEVEGLRLALLLPPGGEGTVSGSLDISGSPRAYRTRLDGEAVQASYPPYLDSLEKVRVKADGNLALQPLSYRGTVDLDGAGLFARPNASDPAILDSVESFQVAADGILTRELAALAADVRLDASGVTISEATLLNLHAEGRVEDARVRIAALSGLLPEGRTFSASGSATLEPLLKEADLNLRLVRPVDQVREAELSATLRDGIVELSVPRADTDAGPVSLTATVPLSSLAQFPEVAQALAPLSIAAAPGEVVLSVQAPELDSQSLLAALGEAPRSERLRAGLTADMTFDPARPAAGRGEVRVDGLAVDTDDGRVVADGPVVAHLEAGRLELRPLLLRIEGTEIGTAPPLRVSGTADLDPSWQPLEDPPEALVRNLSARADGTLEAALLNPWLEGGIGSGTLTLAASADGPPDHLQADFQAEGKDASFLFPEAGAEIDSPSLSGTVDGERWSAQGKAVLNDGEVAFGARPAPEGGARVSVNLSDVAFRLDYGLTTWLSGLLSVHVPFEEGGRIAVGGTVSVDRGVLVRDINLDREVLTLLFEPEDTPGTEETVLSKMDLRLDVTTVDGVRVKNNVGDLRASWDTLHVTGTAEEPRIRGRVEIDPGGLLYVYGQTARVDRGALIFTGNPLEDPLVDISTTSSIEDPTIARLRGSQAPLDVLDQPDTEAVGYQAPGAGDILASGLAGYYGARVVSRLGESVGLSHITVRPVLVFGEADPSARLTVGGDLSRNVSVAVSVDLRSPERRTWLLDLHGFRGLSGLTLEGFTNDEGGKGASLQQTLELGGSKVAEEKGDRLRRLRIEAPKGVSKRVLRRAILLRRKGIVPRGTPFEIEVDLADVLRRRGYPGARVRAETVPVADRPGWVDVNVSVVLGPRVEIVFAGDRPPHSFRSEIEATYRADFFEARSLAEMKQAAVSAFRSEGHLDPRVEIEVRRDPGRPSDPLGPRTVTVRSAAGPHVELEEVVIAGVDPEAGRLAALPFPGLLSRTELAAATPGADRRLLAALARLGYPRARIAGRELERDGHRLTVRVEPGEREVFGRVELAGVEGEERERLAALLPIHAGDPVRLDLASDAALAMERSLKAEGHPDAEVRAVVAPIVGPSVRDVRDIVYEVHPGPQVRLAEVRFEGQRWTRPAQLVKAADLATGEPLDEQAVGEARGRLYRTGAFSRVTTDVSRPEEGEARVTFSLVEKPRFHLGYGVRWESGLGTAAVVDAVDSNFLGRGLTLGARALYEPDDRSGRLFLRTGGLFGTGVSVETYGLVRNEILRDEEATLGPIERDIRESALQFARPFGRRTTGRLYFRYRTTHLFQQKPDPSSPIAIDLEIRRPYMGTQVFYDGRNDPLDPTAGVFRSLDLSGSGPFLGSDFDYARLYGQLNLYRTFRIAGRPVVWAQALRSGWARAFAGQVLIDDDRFRTGGEFSVRGYERESLEVTSDLAEETLFVLNQELRFPLPFEGLAGLVFFDAGQVWEGTSGFGTDLAKSLGLGLRAKTPVGLIRFDTAFPLDRRPGDDSFRLYLGFGNAF